MNSTRKRLLHNGQGVFTVREEVCPQPAAGEVLIEVMASSISPGTELGKFVGKDSVETPEDKWRAFGYQNAGVVMGLGEGVAQYQIGQRVAAMGGAYAEHTTHACVPVNLVVPLPDELSFDEGALIALAGTALNAVRRAELQLGEHALVMGLGVVGQFVAQLAQMAGAHVLAVDRFSLRRDAANCCGVTSTCGPEDDLLELATRFSRGYGMDAGFICFGGNATAPFKQLVATLKRSPDKHIYGRVVIVGGATVEHRFGAPGNFDIRSAARTGPGYHDPAWEYGADYPKVFVPWSTQRNMEELIGWMVSGRLKVKPFITHMVPLADGPEMCRTIIEHPEQTLGVVLKMQ